MESRVSRRDSEDIRRKQLIDTTILVMAQVGFNATTLGLIAKQAGVSAGLVAHYFGDKDGLLEATLRSLASRLSRAAAARMRAATTPRARLAGGDRCQSRAGGDGCADRRRLARLLGPGDPFRPSQTRAAHLSAARALQSASCAAGARARRGGGASRGDHRRDHRRAVAADDARRFLEPRGFGGGAAHRRRFRRYPACRLRQKDF